MSDHKLLLMYISPWPFRMHWTKSDALTVDVSKYIDDLILCIRAKTGNM